MADPMSGDQPSTPMTPDGTEAPPTDAGNDSTTLVTICKEAGGGYVVYSGEKPDAAAPDGGDGSASGTPADSVGAALKATLDILKAGENGDEQGDFNAGFDGGSNASPAKAAPMAPPA